MKHERHSRHNKHAPYWAGMLLVLLLSGLSTIWFDLGTFGNGYVLDMAGPAWTYILFRGLFTAEASNKWTRFFTPAATYAILITVAFGIEIMQYFEVYPSTFDIFDFVAYASILTPIFIIDFYQSNT